MFFMFLLHDYNLCICGSPCYIAGYHNYQSISQVVGSIEADN